MILFVRMAIKKTRNNYCWQGYGEKGTLIKCCRECKLEKTLWRCLKKLGIEIQYDPPTPLLGIYPKNTQTVMQIFISNIPHDRRIGKT